MSDHYRLDRMWSQEKLEEATMQVQRLRSAIARKDVAPTTGLIEHILLSLSKDLDTHSVVGALNDWVDETLNGAVGGSSEKLQLIIENLLGYK